MLLLLDNIINTFEINELEKRVNYSILIYLIDNIFILNYKICSLKII